MPLYTASGTAVAVSTQSGGIRKTWQVTGRVLGRSFLSTIATTDAVRTIPVPVFKHPRLAYHSEDVFVGWHDGDEAGRDVKEIDVYPKMGLNNVAGAIASKNGEVLRFLFPNPTRIEGILPLFWILQSTSELGPGIPSAPTVNLRYSTDSLTGDDGTWVEIGPTTVKTFYIRWRYANGDVPGSEATSKPVFGQSAYLQQGWYVYGMSVRADWNEREFQIFRTSTKNEPDGGIIPMRLRHVRALEVSCPTGAVGHVFLYGAAEPSYWQQGLEILEADRTDPLRPERAFLGKVVKHSSEDILLRVRNASPNLTADDITVDLEPTPDRYNYLHERQFLFSLDGVNFSESVQIGELSPNATSTIITMRRVTGYEHRPDMEQLEGPGQAIVRASTERWW